MPLFFGAPFVFETKLGNSLILSSIWRIVGVSHSIPLRVPIAFQAMPLLQRFSDPWRKAAVSIRIPISEYQLFSKQRRRPLRFTFHRVSRYMIVKEHKKTPGFHQRLGVSCLWIPLSSGISLFFIRLREAYLYHDICAVDSKQGAISK